MIDVPPATGFAVTAAVVKSPLALFGHASAPPATVWKAQSALMTPLVVPSSPLPPVEMMQPVPMLANMMIKASLFMGPPLRDGSVHVGRLNSSCFTGNPRASTMPSRVISLADAVLCRTIRDLYDQFDGSQAHGIAHDHVALLDGGAM